MHPAAKFIVAMFEPHPLGRVYVASLPNPEHKGVEPDERHILTRSSAQITDFVARHDQPGHGCFACVATIQDKATRRAEKTVAQIVVCTPKSTFASSKKRQKKPNTSSVTCHCRRAASITPGMGCISTGFSRPRSPPRQKAMHGTSSCCGARPTTSAAIRAACRFPQLLRLPGTTNSKNGEQREVRVLADRQELRYELGRAQSPLGRLCRRAADLSARPGVATAAARTTRSWRSRRNTPTRNRSTSIGLLADMVYLGPGGGGNAHDTLFAVPPPCSRAAKTARPWWRGR